MNNLAVPCSRIYVNISKAENGYVVQVNERTFVFSSFLDACAFLQQAFGE